MALAKSKFNKTLEDLEREVLEVLSPSEGFSQEAVQSFETFIREANFTVDNHQVDPDKFFWLKPLYQLSRDDIVGVKGEDGKWLKKPRFPLGILFRKASQMGASVWSILFLLWLCIDPERGLYIGCYWPGQGEVQSFVQGRLDPLIASSPKMASYIGASSVDSTVLKQIGRSTVFFRWVGGKSGADSVPLDVILCDEIRLWDTPDETLQRIRERYGQSEVKLIVYMSTVGKPYDFMETSWEESNQFKYFSECPAGCHTEIAASPRESNRLLTRSLLYEQDPNLMLVEGVVISDWEPDKMSRYTDEGKDACYVCPCCGEDILDPEQGPGYVETRPNATGSWGIELARTLSPETGAFMLKEERRKSKDLKQFYNGFLAKPYRDPAGTLVKEGHWKLHRDESIMWHSSAPDGGPTLMGVDFRTREIHVVIGQAPGAGKGGQLLHLSVLQDRWEEQRETLSRLIAQYNISRAILDYGPQTTQALDLAEEFDGLIYLALYRPSEKRIRLRSETTDRALSPDGRERYLVLMDQILSMKYSLNSFAQGAWKVPAEPLLQSNYLDRNRDLHETFDLAEGLEGKGREGFKHHIMGLSLQTEHHSTKIGTGETLRLSAKYSEKIVDASGFDPHFAHAFNYMVHAGEIEPGEGTLVVPQARDVYRGANPMQSAQSAIQSRIGTPLPNAGRTCGTCLYGPEGQSPAVCQLIGYDAHPRDPQCSPRNYRPRPRPDAFDPYQ